MSDKEREKFDINEEYTGKFITELAEEEDFDLITKDEHSHRSHSSHHHHHHRHHHHSHSAKKRRKKTNQNRKEKFDRFIRHNKKYLIYCLITFIVLLCLLFVGKYLDRKIGVYDKQQDAQSDNFETNLTSGHIQIDVPFFSEDVVIAGPAVWAFVNAEEGTAVSEIYNQYKAADIRLDVGKPVELSYEVSELPDGYSVKKAEFLVADNKELDNPYIFNSDGYTTKVDVYNLKTGTQYYYRINLTFTNDIESSVSGSFRTMSGPRILMVDGVYNIRDIGGWKTVDGKEIKQGLLYRGCEIDGAVESGYTITEAGINTMLTEFGIKTDMDLRAATDNIYGTDVLGAGVKHIYYATDSYSQIFSSKENGEKIRKLFSDLSNKNNYPAYLHCTYGQDRTGTVCYLLEALLGVDENSMMKDYLLSGLHHGDVYDAADYMDYFIAEIKKLPGETMSEKVEGYLLSIGVTQEEIKSIRDIFLYD